MFLWRAVRAEVFGILHSGIQISLDFHSNFSLARFYNERFQPKTPRSYASASN